VKETTEILKEFQGIDFLNKIIEQGILLSLEKARQRTTKHV